MALSVVVQPTKQGAANSQVGGSASKVVIESDLTKFPLAISELQGADSRKLAMEFAASRGMASPACGMPGAAYPVDAEGEVIVDPINQKISRYRIDVPLTSRF